MSANSPCFLRHIWTLSLAILAPSAGAQLLANTSFEGHADQTVFSQTLLRAEGLTIPWTNGFNQDRTHIDLDQARVGSASLRVSYPVDTYGPSDNGAQAPIMVTASDELYASYWVRFGEDFDWGGRSEGGKLPGLAGGNRCSGCATCTGSNGFSARLMWRPSGKAVIYLYHMDKTGACGDDDPLQVTPGQDFYFQKGQWHHVTQRVKINSGSNNDGEVEVWLDGQRALLRTSLKFVTNGDKVDALYFSTFHGGSNMDWAPSLTCHSWFDDIKIGTTFESVAATESVSTLGAASVPNRPHGGQETVLRADPAHGIVVHLPHRGEFTLRGEALVD